MLEKITINTHSSIRIEDERIIYADPYKINGEPHDADVILITHEHFDHYSPEDIKRAAKPDTIVVCPESMDEPEELGLDVHYVALRQKFEACGIRFETLPAYNNEKPFHPKNNGWVGYIINSPGLGKIYIAGDTDITDENSGVKCRIAFVPIGGTYTMDAESAAELVNTIKPEYAVPVHYGSIIGGEEDFEVFRRNVESGINVVAKLKPNYEEMCVAL